MGRMHTKEWLVKTSGRILGPFMERDIAERLRTRELVSLDEIMSPGGRWGYIRDEAIFAKVVEEIRTKNIRGAGDDATVTHTNSNTEDLNTESISQTQPDDLTAEITASSVAGGNVQDVMFQSIEDDVRKPSLNTYTYEGDRLIASSAEKTARWVWIATFVLIMVTVSFVFFRQFISRPVQQKNLAEEHTIAGIEALERGDEYEALNRFNKAYSINENDQGIYLYLGVLKIQVENQPFTGRRLLESLLFQSDKDAKRVLTAIGLSYLRENNPSAAEDYFNKALAVDPLFSEAMINLGAAALAQEDLHKANNQLQLAIKDGSRDGVEFLMLADALYRLWQREKERRYLQDAIRYLDLFAESSRDYLIEARLTRLFIASLLIPNLNVYQEIDRLLDMDTLQTESHRHNLFLHRDLATWQRLAQWCLKLTENLDPQSHVLALEAICLHKAGDLTESNRKIDDAVQQTPRDPLVQAVYGQILLDLGSVDQAKVAVAKALEYDNPRKLMQPRRGMARLCEIQGDAACAGKYWQEVLEMQHDALAALAGTTRYYLTQSQVEEAKKFLMKGVRLSKEFKPFLILNREVSRIEAIGRSRGL